MVRDAKPGKRAESGEPMGLSLALLALDELAGAALVLDARLAVRGATPAAQALLEGAVANGASAAKVLCGGAIDRPIAVALAEGRAVTWLVTRPSLSGDRKLRVRAMPLLVDTDLPPEIVDPAAAGEVVVNVPPPASGAEPSEVARIRRALERSGGSRERAARMLGMSRVTLWRRMKQLAITPSD